MMELKAIICDFDIRPVESAGDHPKIEVNARLIWRDTKEGIKYIDCKSIKSDIEKTISANINKD